MSGCGVDDHEDPSTKIRDQKMTNSMLAHLTVYYSLMFSLALGIILEGFMIVGYRPDGTELPNIVPAFCAVGQAEQRRGFLRTAGLASLLFLGESYIRPRKLTSCSTLPTLSWRFLSLKSTIARYRPTKRACQSSRI